MKFTRLQQLQIRLIAATHEYDVRFDESQMSVMFGTWHQIKAPLLEDLAKLNIHLEEFISDTKDGGSYQFNRIAYTLKDASIPC